MTSRNQRGDRPRRAILAVLRAHTGPPLTVKELAREAAKLGPDAPTIRPVVHRMVRQGDLVIVGQRDNGTRLLDMPIMLAPTQPTTH